MSPRLIAKILAATGLVALTAIVVMGVWVVRHHNAAAVAKTVRMERGTLLRAKTFHWTEMKGDGKQWELVATEASYADSKTSLKLLDAVLSMTAQDGKEVAVHSVRADLKLSGNHVVQVDLGGGVNLRYGDVTLDTDKLVFFPDKDSMHAPGKVFVNGAGFKITGVGMDARPRAKTFVFNSQVDTQLTPVDKRGAAKKG